MGAYENALREEGSREDLLAALEKAWDELEELRGDAKFLNALMIAGVDNWDGYEIAQESLLR